MPNHLQSVFIWLKSPVRLDSIARYFRKPFPLSVCSGLPRSRGVDLTTIKRRTTKANRVFPTLQKSTVFRDSPSSSRIWCACDYIKSTLLDLLERNDALSEMSHWHCRKGQTSPANILRAMKNPGSALMTLCGEGAFTRIYGRSTLGNVNSPKASVACLRLRWK